LLVQEKSALEKSLFYNALRDFAPQLWHPPSDTHGNLAIRYSGKIGFSPERIFNVYYHVFFIILDNVIFMVGWNCTQNYWNKMEILMLRKEEKCLIQ